MAQKIHPTGFRIGISKDWSTKWYADKKQYGKNVLQDHVIREYVKNKFDVAGLKNIEIARSANDINLTLHVSKPGVVIGKSGAIVAGAKNDLEKLTSAKVSITAEQVKVPEIEAQLVGDFISRQLQRRKNYRRVVNAALQSAMDKGALGIKIKVSGLLSGGNSIARSETFSKGPVPTQTLRADIDYAQIHSQQLFGTIGIKVWIYKGELDL
ncbi:MAG: 30S ribosomal protein S3 [Patescibacteria group bacterium]|uniref:Small ribosomal subunit protein uS3 n=1 Tax=candidate division WWE3 bacterium TaxID=2053526 RepID=A0A955EDW3_UNCKA|nr:30S ribosomal protein S3 [candidate division WWE3 bacterium]